MKLCFRIMLKIHEEIEIEQVKVAPKALYPDFIDSCENKNQSATDETFGFAVCCLALAIFTPMNPQQARKKD